MAGGDSAHLNSNYGSGGGVNSFDFGMGDNSVNMKNPGSLDPSQLNPYAAAYLSKLNGVSDQYKGVADQYLNSDYYNKMMNEYGQRAQTSVDNNFARMGMAGSSAAAGAGMEAQRQNTMMWNQKRLQDAGTAASMMSGLDQRGYQGVMGIQNQYGGFQNSMADAYINMLNAQQQQQQMNNQLYGSLIPFFVNPLGSGAGSMGGGMMGAAAAA